MIKIIKPGLYSTIQDKGRVGMQSHGIPCSGTMDTFSSDLANKILNNSGNSAVLEITMVGPVLEFVYETVICITGANLSPLLNNKIIKMNNPIFIKSNDILSFGVLKSGLRSYIAVLGGFKSEKVFGSRSMFKNLTRAVKLAKNDVLNFNKDIIFKSSKINLNKTSNIDNKIVVYKGPEYDTLNSSQKDFILSKKFRISNNYNRMAIQLTDLLSNTLEPIITSMVMPGTVQLTPAGNLIILMKDCQTTGGYPRILQVEEKSINSLAQLKKDSELWFSLKI
ncbi:MAG: biotin-dependent carboxyltransferase family protein [Flavobacteriaceae bacterium]|nr:biotin-dependent carboxyltransferase family protein [Flavobacteriaceae bacterium]